MHTVPTEKKSFDGEDDTDIPRASPANGRSFTSSPHASSSLPLFWLLKQRTISDNKKSKGQIDKSATNLGRQPSPQPCFHRCEPPFPSILHQHSTKSRPCGTESNKINNRKGNCVSYVGLIVLGHFAGTSHGTLLRISTSHFFAQFNSNKEKTREFNGRRLPDKNPLVFTQQIIIHVLWVEVLVIQRGCRSGRRRVTSNSRAAPAETEREAVAVSET